MSIFEVKDIFGEAKEIQIKQFTDCRGSYSVLWEHGEIDGISHNFKRLAHTVSHKGVFRGLHYQENYSQSKLVSVVKGSVYDVIVDIRKDSPTYGKWYGTIISDKNNKMLFIPKGFAHGFLSLEDDTHFIYLCDEKRVAEEERGIHYKSFGIELPEEPTVITERDNGYEILY